MKQDKSSALNDETNRLRNGNEKAFEESSSDEQIDNFLDPTIKSDTSYTQKKHEFFFEQFISSLDNPGSIPEKNCNESQKRRKLNEIDEPSNPDFLSSLLDEMEAARTINGTPSNPLESGLPDDPYFNASVGAESFQTLRTPEDYPEDYKDKTIKERKEILDKLYEKSPELLASTRVYSENEFQFAYKKLNKQQKKKFRSVNKPFNEKINLRQKKSSDNKLKIIREKAQEEGVEKLINPNTSINTLLKIRFALSKDKVLSEKFKELLEDKFDADTLLAMNPKTLSDFKFIYQQLNKKDESKAKEYGEKYPDMLASYKSEIKKHNELERLRRPQKFKKK